MYLKHFFQTSPLNVITIEKVIFTSVPEAAVCRNLNFVIFVYCDRKKDSKQKKKKKAFVVSGLC